MLLDTKGVILDTKGNPNQVYPPDVCIIPSPLCVVATATAGECTRSSIQCLSTRFVISVRDGVTIMHHTQIYNNLQITSAPHPPLPA